MAYPWACDFNPHVQMESRIKRRVLSIIVAGAMITSTSTVFAATTAPKPVAKKAAAWPPKPPFINPDKGEIYYKIPKPQELAGALSAVAALATQIKPCTTHACGVVTVASTNGCKWWEIDSIVYGPLSPTDSSLAPYGNLTTTVKATSRKQIITVILVSTQPLKKNVNVGKIQVYCHHDPVTASTQKVPSNIYKIYTPTPSPLPTPSDAAALNTN